MKKLSETLKKIIEQYGISIIDQDQRLKAMIADLLPREKRIGFLLELSIRAEIPKKLFEILSEDSSIFNTKINSIKQYFKDEYYLDDKAVELIFSCWMEVLDGFQKTKESKRNKDDRFYYTESINGINLKLVSIEGGRFHMGSSEKDIFCLGQPVQIVTLDNFYISETQITQKQWRNIMGHNPSYHRNCEDCPVENISWNSIQKFLQTLNHNASKNYRLPTEAEWEFAARGGKMSKGYIYSGSNNLNDVAWFNQGGDLKSHPVAQKQPNELGIYDMSGNVYEWCADWSSEYRPSAQKNPKGPKSGVFRVLRGGGWSSNAHACRSIYRASERPDVRNNLFGFRIVFSP